MSWADLVNRMSTRPAEIAGYTNQGKQIAQGVEANLVLLDPALSWTVRRSELKSKSKNTPFNMMSLPGVITDVFYSGKHVFGKNR